MKSGCGRLLITTVEKATAFWFGRREHKHLDKLVELLRPFTIGKCIRMATMRIMSIIHQRF
jgi:IS1 family transposase